MYIFPIWEMTIALAPLTYIGMTPAKNNKLIMGDMIIFLSVNFLCSIPISKILKVLKLLLGSFRYKGLVTWATNML